MLALANHKAFLWLPGYPTNNDMTKDHRTKSIQLLQNKFKFIMAAFNDYITHGDQGPNENTNVLCSRDAMAVIKYFTGKEAGTKATSAYKNGDTAPATANSHMKTRSTSLKQCQGSLS
jgi:hypothetical protein